MFLDPRGPVPRGSFALLAACGGDVAILHTVGETFRAGLPDKRKAAQDALCDGDVSGLREAAHKLFGMVAVFSTVAGRVASDLEDQAARGQLRERRPWWRGWRR